MPRSCYRFTEEDVPVVHRWVHVKLRDATWLQHEEAHTTWDQFPREQLTLSETIERYLADVAVISQPQDTPHTTKQTPAQQTVDTRVPKQSIPAATSSQKHGSAFITTKKGVCYLTIKIGRHHFSIMRIRNYTIDAQDKRDMHRLHPDVDFDWKKIARQLVENREVCQRYRSRRCPTRVPREHEPFYGVFEPHTRGVYVNDLDNIAGVSALLDSLLSSGR